MATCRSLWEQRLHSLMFFGGVSVLLRLVLQSMVRELEGVSGKCLLCDCACVLACACASASACACACACGCVCVCVAVALFVCVCVCCVRSSVMDFGRSLSNDSNRLQENRTRPMTCEPVPLNL